MLNRAHWLHRQAEKATRKGNVEEAVKYHKEAADILNQLLQNILDEKVAESLRLQVESRGYCLLSTYLSPITICRLSCTRRNEPFFDINEKKLKRSTVKV